jgi:hypothetical protein
MKSIRKIVLLASLDDEILQHFEFYIISRFIAFGIMSHEIGIMGGFDFRGNTCGSSPVFFDDLRTDILADQKIIE